MARFRACPREGHLDRLKRLYGYLRKYKHGAIRVRTQIPDMSQYPEVEYDWMYLVYGDVQEAVPHDAPMPLGKEVITITYEDLYHDMTTGRAVMGVLHLRHTHRLVFQASGHRRDGNLRIGVCCSTHCN